MKKICSFFSKTTNTTVQSAVNCWELQWKVLITQDRNITRGLLNWIFFIARNSWMKNVLLHDLQTGGPSATDPAKQHSSQMNNGRGVSFSVSEVRLWTKSGYLYDFQWTVHKVLVLLKKHRCNKLSGRDLYVQSSLISEKISIRWTILQLIKTHY